MLGIQENRPDAGSLPARTYRCMACAAVFPGLSSLLVHQASHANDKMSDSLQSPADSSQEPCSSCGTIFANKEILAQHNCKAVDTTSSAPVYMSERRSDFQDVNTINEHRESHGVNPQVNTLTQGTDNASEIRNHTQHGSTFSPDRQSFNVISQSVPVLLVHPPYQKLSSKLSDTEVDAKAAETIFPVSQPTEFPSLPIHIASQDFLLHTDPSSSNSLSSSEVSGIEQMDVKSPKKTLKKLLVSAFMERLPPAQTSWKPNQEHVFTKTVAPEASTETPVPLGSSVRHLRRLLTKSANKTKVAARNTLGMLNSNKPSTQPVENIMNLNEIFLPVVALETRQKLLGVNKDAQEGRHQCGFCRRVFQHVDNLILHHAVHKKEKIFGCRGCKQLLITKAAIPLHHACPPDNMFPKDPFSQGVVLPPSLGNLGNSTQKSTLEHSSARGPFFCHLCKHGFTRLYGLKKHKCQWFSHAHSSHQKPKVNVNSSSKKMVASQESHIHKNVGVSTESPGVVKVETFEAVRTQVVLLKPQEKGPARLGSPKSFMPFISKTAMQKCPTSETSDMVKTEEEDSVANDSAQEDDEQGQWTVPIDESEIDVLVELENKEDLYLMETGIGDVGSSSKQNGSLSTQLSSNYLTHISEAGKKRFICHNCGKSYARCFTLKHHLKSCQMPASTPVQQDSNKSPSVKGKLCQIKQSFDCLQCGKSFSRRYNMVLHKKKYHSVNAAVIASGSHTETECKISILPEQSQGTSGDPVSQKRMLIIPPPPREEDSGIKSKIQATAGDWGIMSLPSVLPRKVTCECGSVFTCPRLLFEHLQMHAQESFICPQCGETFCSWPNYETHLHTHQRSVCPNCQQTFTHPKSLVRHLSKNRCKATFPSGKRFVCSHCSLELSNYPSLSLHIQNCQRNPSRILIRCTMCTRSFSTKDGLHRHMFTHSHPNAFRCLLCQRSYPSLQSLKDHRRKVHRIKLGSAQAVQSNLGGVI